MKTSKKLVREVQGSEKGTDATRRRSCRHRVAHGAKKHNALLATTNIFPYLDCRNLGCKRPSAKSNFPCAPSHPREPNQTTSGSCQRPPSNLFKESEQRNSNFEPRQKKDFTLSKGYSVPKTSGHNSIIYLTSLYILSFSEVTFLSYINQVH